ncbi:hypothetical protein GLYMA_09G203600v4 [Glycine max]|uniref:Uncharacterized protein n=1 Tax=Glycine max TaxID=3847 RepID=A0A0R0IH06_SOYBN|nr:hypothetical protein GYH30_025657 [Glycine max]KRH39529.1 hypothetical protein GLYMA_09G203600v4 [Glycine max]
MGMYGYFSFSKQKICNCASILLGQKIITQPQDSRTNKDICFFLSQYRALKPVMCRGLSFYVSEEFTRKASSCFFISVMLSAPTKHCCLLYNLAD